MNELWFHVHGTELPRMHLAVALDGTGWHPAAWREERARPAELFTARYWADVIAEAERGLLGFVAFRKVRNISNPSAPPSATER